MQVIMDEVFIPYETKVQIEEYFKEDYLWSSIK